MQLTNVTISNFRGYWGSNCAKAFIANAAVSEMNQARLAAIDSAGDVAGRFEKINELM